MYTFIEKLKADFVASGQITLTGPEITTIRLTTFQGNGEINRFLPVISYNAVPRQSNLGS